MKTDNLTFTQPLPQFDNTAAQSASTPVGNLLESLSAADSIVSQAAKNIPELDQLFQCCVCNNYACEELLALQAHMAQERTEGDASGVNPGSNPDILVKSTPKFWIFR